ncbi:beta-propeller domain-containing protein [Paenibacillus sp. IB182496]|uniref:Beta-propeller domain-containing protein n=1 Tax=Paenibacillus sabuli TaxID=2772509 RepID=A0A927GR65_9BACL|nr:beta-propeller domain-containing protein [Paenibacillus sabuli]MBD2844981.1 beta-propeller domain-containing protein [Paenibacillus sabuli]
MKRWASLVLAAAIVLTPASAGQRVDAAIGQQADVRIVLRGDTLATDTPVRLEGGTALVPLRQIAEALGARVEWQGREDHGSVRIRAGAREALLTIGTRTMTANGLELALPTAPRLEGDTTLVPLRAISEALGAVVAWDGRTRAVYIDDPAELPVIGSHDRLQELLAAAGGERPELAQSADEATAAPAAESESASGLAAGADRHAETNVQVEGVDEADTAKTDGRYIYQISGQRVLISDISDPQTPSLAAAIDYPVEDAFQPLELYVREGQLVVIGQSSLPMAWPQQRPDDAEDTAVPAPSAAAPVDEPERAATDARIGILPMPMHSAVRAMHYTLDAQGEPALARTVELEGGYVSSRMIGSALYLVASKYDYAYPLLRGGADNPETGRVAYADSAADEAQHALGLDAIRYFPEPTGGGMLTIGALDLDRPQQQMEVSAYLGAGQTIYASSRHLYVAIPGYDGQDGSYTRVHKFRLDQGRVVYIGEGRVKGTPLNQFAMDEHQGYFRIATTSGTGWGGEDAANNLYVLDERLQTIGALEGLAPGERIYSVRFMGGRAYMVTFRNVDPLFAIDLRDPAQPAVLGQLKIPGYSDYLHPYDEHHLIGFGKETVTVPVKGAGPDDVVAYAQGLKLALFDVTDVNAPKEKFKTVIGDRGTDSELLRNHKALLFDKARGLLAFPVQVMETPEGREAQEGMPAYGEFAYQGAYVYAIDEKAGFRLRGRITHLDEDELKQSATYGADYRAYVQRILYAGDTLYTLSERMLRGSAIDTLETQGELLYPGSEQAGGGQPARPSLPVPLAVPEAS